MALWVFLLIALAVGFIVAHAYVLPTAFLKMKYDSDNLPDRGIKAIDEEDGGRTIVYEPDIRLQNYVKKYILSERDGKKYFVCKIDDDIKYLDYDIVLFDKNGNSFKILTVKELIEKRGITRTTELPDKTVYVSLALNEVNDEKIKGSITKKVQFKGVALHLIFSTIIEVFSVLSVKTLIGKMFGGIFFESFVFVGSTWIFTLLLCLSIVSANVIITLFLVLIKNSERKGVKGNG